VSTQREIDEEQAFLDRAYEALDVMRAEARAMLDGVLDTGRGGTFQSRTERDIVVRTSLARLEHLDVGDQALTFGRIDVAGPTPSAAPEVFHIGRLAVSDERREPMIIDWRAPIAEPFYRATGLDPQGLVRRRHLAVSHRTVTGVEDEFFIAGAAADAAPPTVGGKGEGLEDVGFALGGPGALLAALGQARTGQMGDIIGTIQAEQDEIIRAGLPGVLVVQGGPGTGKTAVALHRAAYLLYTHRFPLERQGVLVVGPNPLFLRYIEQVLPSLGETGVTLSTISGLVSLVKVTGTDPEAVERLKGDPRMVDVLARAVRTRERGLREPARIPLGATTLRLEVDVTAAIVRRARRRGGTHNARRRVVETEVLADLAAQFRGRRGSDLEDDEFDMADFAAQVRRTPEFQEAMARMWPRLSPHELLHDLFGAPALLAAAGADILSPAECERLERPRSTSLETVAWTAGDVALIDEAAALLGPRRPTQRRRREGRDQGGWPQGLDGLDAPTERNPDELIAFGHIVVDEIQDLSPMQLRMLGRRSLSGSMTVVGDIAQASGPWAPSSWTEILAHLAPRRDPHVVELTVSYRTPAEVLEVARHVLDAAAVGLEAPTAVRRAGTLPSFEQVASSDLAAGVVAAALDEAAEVAPGHVAVLAPRRHLDDLRRAFAEAGVAIVDPKASGGPGLAAPLVLLDAAHANGLEFDGVVVVEPAEIASGMTPADAPSSRGLRSLYVAITRPTRRLRTVGTTPFPVPLDLDGGMPQAPLPRG
jgi:DNA helicase IV